jgi:HlyD family secretion protein
MRVTSSRGWIALVALVAVVAAVILYGFFGNAPTTVRGSGLLLPPGGLIQIDAAEAGTVTEIRTAIGRDVEVGYVVARMKRADGEPIDVVTPRAGHIAEVLVDSGNVIAPGTPLMVLEPAHQTANAVVYMPAGQGKSIRPGMEVHLSPSTAASEEYGEIIGIVDSISEFPVSPERLQFVVNNSLLVQQLSRLGSVLEVNVSITQDHTTVSGIKWTSGEGPPFEINNGTLTSASVILDQETPASKLFAPKG